MEERKDKFKLLRDTDGVIILHDRNAEKEEDERVLVGRDGTLSKESLLKALDKFKTSNK